LTGKIKANNFHATRLAKKFIHKICISVLVNQVIFCAAEIMAASSGVCGLRDILELREQGFTEADVSR
jgi:hypothetical protein